MITNYKQMDGRMNLTKKLSYPHDSAPLQCKSSSLTPPLSIIAASKERKQLLMFLYRFYHGNTSFISLLLMKTEHVVCPHLQKPHRTDWHKYV